jgi:uncharacterized protein (DUF983 family)
LNNERPAIFALLSRCVRLRCPVCGRASIVARPFHVNHHCPSCDALFQREDGFFVGAIMVNVVTTEVFIIAVYLAFLMLIGSHYQLMITLLLVLALVFPLAFYHHSWSIWLSFDHLVEKLPRRVAPTPPPAEGRRNGQL